jgi:hypothetical protein
MALQLQWPEVIIEEQTTVTSQLLTGITQVTTVVRRDQSNSIQHNTTHYNTTQPKSIQSD